MARTVSLSDEAFATLRSDKRPGESDSDVVLRLYETAHRRECDPYAFIERPPRSDWTPASREQVDADMAAADEARFRDQRHGA